MTMLADVTSAPRLHPRFISHALQRAYEQFPRPRQHREQMATQTTYYADSYTEQIARTKLNACKRRQAQKKGLPIPPALAPESTPNIPTLTSPA